MSIYLGSSEPSKVYVGSSEVKSVYVGTTKVRPSGWKPGANTVAYYPLSEDFNDKSGNGYNLANNGGSITTFNGVKCAYYSGSTSVYSYNTSAPVSGTRTINCWVYCTEATNTDSSILWTGAYNTSYKGNVLTLSYSRGVGVCAVSDYVATGFSGTTNIVGKWVNLIGVVEGTSMKLYANGVQEGTRTKNYSASSSAGIIIAGTNGGNFNPQPVFKGYVSRAIVESKARTAQEISDYYNLTKSNYGL